MKKSWTSGIAPEEKSGPDEHGQKYNSYAAGREREEVFGTHATCGTLAASTESSSAHVYNAFDDDVSAAKALKNGGASRKTWVGWFHLETVQGVIQS